MISFVSQDLTWLNLDRIVPLKACSGISAYIWSGDKKRCWRSASSRAPQSGVVLLFGEQKSIGAVFWLRMATNRAIDAFEGSVFHFWHAAPAFYRHIIPGLWGFGASTSGSCLKQKSLNYLLTVLRWNNLAVFLFSDSCSTCFIELLDKKKKNSFKKVDTDEIILLWEMLWCLFSYKYIYLLLHLILAWNVL